MQKLFCFSGILKVPSYHHEMEYLNIHPGKKVRILIFLANYTNEIMASRFSEVMWLIEQIMWKSFDKRLASFLLEESSLEDTNILQITHEKIANHLGTAREVVTRMLRYFQNEGAVKLSRGTITILQSEYLQNLADN